MSRLVLVAALSLALLPALSAGASAGVPGRGAEPVVVTGERTAGLLGTAPERVVGFRYAGRWRPIPVQVDERKLVDYAAVRGNTSADRPFSALAYADPDTFAGPDPDPGLDGDDEIAAMAMDAGRRRPAGAAPPAGTAPASLTELRLVDPLSEGARPRFIYLARSRGGLDPAAGRRYVDYDFRLLSGDYKTTYDFDGVPGGGSSAGGPPSSPERSTVATSRYSMRMIARWTTDRLELAAAPGTDLLDGDKVQTSYGCGRSEVTFSRGGGGFIANIDGPVRAIRSYIGANSGTYTQRDQVFYQRSEVSTIHLRVHPGIETITSFLDYSRDADGLTYRSSARPDGALIDGVPDPGLETDATLGPPLLWEQTSGAGGTITLVNRVASDIPGLGLGSFYEDDLTPDVPQCNGYADAEAHGASGPTVTGTGPFNTDPARPGLGPVHHLEGTRTTFFSAPGGGAELAARRAAQVDEPLRIAARFAGLDLDAPATKRLPPRRRGRVGVRLGARGGEEPVTVRVCGRTDRGLAAVGPCRSVHGLAPGDEVRVRLAVRLRRRAAGAGPVRLRLSARAAGRIAATGTVRLRPQRRR